MEFRVTCRVDVEMVGLLTVVWRVVGDARVVVCEGVLVWRAVGDVRVVKELEDEDAREVTGGGRRSVVDGVVSEFVVSVIVSLL